MSSSSSSNNNHLPFFTLHPLHVILDLHRGDWFRTNISLFFHKKFVRYCTFFLELIIHLKYPQITHMFNSLFFWLVIFRTQQEHTIHVHCFLVTLLGSNLQSLKTITNVSKRVRLVGRKESERKKNYTNQWMNLDYLLSKFIH
jgi:hypothetical protein